MSKLKPNPELVQLILSYGGDAKVLKPQSLQGSVLDRIDGVAPAKTTFVPYKGKDVEKYFDNTIGVTIKDGGVKEIRLWFSPTQGNYIKTQKLHETQQIISDTREGLIVSVQLIINYEMVQTLMAFGPEVKVLEPATLLDEIKDRIRKNLQLYET